MSNNQIDETGEYVYALAPKAARLIKSAFDEVFEQLEAPNYPATCDECGLVGTNESMADHECARFMVWPCCIGDHDACAWRSKDGECPCLCGHAEAKKASNE